MKAYKKFLSTDVTVSPLILNKGFRLDLFYEAGSPNFDRYIGENVTGSYIDFTGSLTGVAPQLYKPVVYNSIKHLYYSNYQTSSYGDEINSPVLIPGEDEEGNYFVGLPHNPNYENYLQSSISFQKYFPTGSGDQIGVIAIPSDFYGEFIQPGSFLIESGSNYLVDDGEGNIISPDNGGRIVGNIFYSHGMIVLTNNYSNSTASLWDTSSYDNSYYDSYPSEPIIGYITGDVICSFSSSLVIYEHQFKCSIEENEFNFTNNKTISDNEGNYNNYINSSSFSPYITTIGLYNDNGDLLAVSKMKYPIKKSRDTDMHFVISLDMQ